MLPVLFLMGIGPAFTWARSDVSTIIKKFRVSFILSFLLALSIPYLFTHELHWPLILGLSLSFWIILATFQNIGFKVKRNGMLFAHLGFAICVIGIVASETFSVQKDVRMHLGDTVSVANYQFQFFGTHQIDGSNYQAEEGQVRVTKYHQYVTTLHPQLRLYKTQNMAIAKTAIHATPFRDLYVALGEPLANQDWSLRIYYKPFIRWIWAGGLLMLLGGLISATHFRYRTRTLKAVQR
jgi:cytochrome c-type biogenesis protein CcmF